MAQALHAKPIATRRNVSTARSLPYGEYTHVRTPRSNVCIASPRLVSAFTYVLQRRTLRALSEWRQFNTEHVQRVRVLPYERGVA